MLRISRRELLAWFAVAPTLPRFLVDSAHALSAQSLPGADGPVVVVVRMLGGNDGLNSVVPFDDRYFKMRPTIAIAKRDTLVMPGGEVGLNPHLADVRRLIDDGHAAIVQGVGYANSSRSHSRAAEIFETGSVAEPAPPHGWLGRYLDHTCSSCDPSQVAGIQFGDALGRTLTSGSSRSLSIAHPQLLLDMQTGVAPAAVARGSRVSRMDYLRQVENDLGAASRELRRATRGRGASYDYPDTTFGQSLRWTANMIETGSPTRVYYATIGSFETATSPSFDTHSQQLDMHRILYGELGQGLRAFVTQLKTAGQLNRVLVLTFSDFGRQVAENRDGGTDHGDASVVFAVGGRIRPGLLGQSANLDRVHDGGLQPSVDFRQIYADVLASWLKVDPAVVLGAATDRFSLVA